MSDWGEPRRWDESELPPEVREALESAKLDEPSHERVAHVQAALAGALGWPNGVEAAPTSSAAAATSTGIAAKAIVGAIVVAGAVGLGVWLTTERAHVPRGTEPVPPAAEPERAAEPASEPEPVPVPTAPADPVALDLPPARTARPTRPAVDPAPPERLTISALEQELRLIDTARAALDRSPESALELTDAHRATFPTGTLTPERELIAVEALLALDRTDEATGRATTLRRDYPASPAAHRAARLITEHAAPQ